MGSGVEIDGFGARGGVALLEEGIKLTEVGTVSRGVCCAS